MKKRLDTILYEQGFFESREKAKAAIMAGIVFVQGQLRDKPGEKIDEKATIKVKGDANPYVSRGGLKLQKAFEIFTFDVKNRTVLDIGASTGGFTDCLLQHGAQKVYSIDVGYGQLAWKLRQDPRVVPMERTNFRYITLENIGEIATRATIDVSFISLAIILKNLYHLIDSKGEIIALIKPQFEAGREKVGKRGVVADPKTHIEVIKKVTDQMRDIGFFIKGLSYSPITGPQGNIEFLSYITKDPNGGMDLIEEEIVRVVEEAHNSLEKN